MTLKRLGGFGLVELIVLIGILVFLVAILLPTISTANSESNLTYCQNNLKQIGELIQVYCSAHNGDMPPVGGWFQTPANASMGANAQHLAPFTWAEVLTLLKGPKDIGAAVPPSQGGPFRYHPANTLGIFHDSDVPLRYPRVMIGNTWQVYTNPAHIGNTCDYVPNIRTFSWTTTPLFQAGGDDGAMGPYPSSGVIYKRKSLFLRQSECATVWCGPVFIDAATNMLQSPGEPGGGVLTNQFIDGYACMSGYCLSYPEPLQNTSGTSAPINGQDLANGGWGYGLTGEYDAPIALGAAGGPSGTFDSWGGVTMAYLQMENHDQTSSGPSTFDDNGNPVDYGFNYNAMRFRHVNDTTTNLLFLDGHVEDRELGTVTPKDISDNVVK